MSIDSEKATGLDIIQIDTMNITLDDVFLEKGIYFNISVSASTNAYNCSLLQKVCLSKDHTLNDSALKKIKS